MASCSGAFSLASLQANLRLSQHGVSLVDRFARRGRRGAAGIHQRGLRFRGRHHLVVLLARNLIFGDEGLVAGDVGLRLGGVGFRLAQIGFCRFVVALRGRNGRVGVGQIGFRARYRCAIRSFGDRHVGIDGADLRFGLQHLALRLVERVLIIARIELGDHLAHFHELVFFHVDRRDRAGHAGADGAQMRVSPAHHRCSRSLRNGSTTTLRRSAATSQHQQNQNGDARKLRAFFGRVTVSAPGGADCGRRSSPVRFASSEYR